jgi:hypothetical protein
VFPPSDAYRTLYEITVNRAEPDDVTESFVARVKAFAYDLPDDGYAPLTPDAAAWLMFYDDARALTDSMVKRANAFPRRKPRLHRVNMLYWLERFNGAKTAHQAFTFAAFAAIDLRRITHPYGSYS